MPIVVGPTPPTRGVMAPATSSHDSSTSGSNRAAFVADAAADDGRARLHVLGLDDAGDAGGGDEDLGLAGVVRPVLHAGVHHGDRGVGRRSLLAEQQCERAAEGGAASEDHDVAARDRDLVVGEQRLDARGRARHRSGHAEREPTHVRGMGGVDVLVRVHHRDGGVVVEVPRDRVLQEQRMDGRVVAVAADLVLDLLLGRAGGQVAVGRLEAELGGGPLLEADVAGAGVVVADEHRRQARRDAVGDELLGALADVGHHRLDDGSSGKQAGAQWKKCLSPVKTMARPSSSAAAMISSSRIDPPGWMTTATPAEAAASMPSRNG